MLGSLVAYPTVASAQSEKADGQWLVFDEIFSLVHLAQHPNGSFYGIILDESNLYQIVEWTGVSWQTVGQKFEADFPRFEPIEDGRLLVATNSGLNEWTGSELLRIANDFGLRSDGAVAVSPAGEIYRSGSVGVWTSSIRVLRGDEWVEIVEVPFIVADLAFDVDGNLIMIGRRDDEDRSVVWLWDGPQWVEIGDFPLGYAKVAVEPDGSLVIGRGQFSDSPELEPLRWDGQVWSPVLDERPPWTLGGSTGCGDLIFIQGEDQVLQLAPSGNQRLIPRRPDGFSYVNGNRIFHQGFYNGISAVWLGADHAASETDSIEDLLTSCDYNSAVQGDVLRLYRAFFNRDPDLAGAKYWLAVNRNGNSLDQIAEQFALSGEFANAYADSSNTEFLAAVYSNVLGRDYDQAGFDYWLGLLDNEQLTRGGVVRWVAANDEFRAKYPF